jgi:hypothetical protein
VNKKYTALKVEFHFEEMTTQKDMDRVTKKVLTYAKNSGLEHIVNFWWTAHQIGVVINFDCTDYGSMIFTEAWANSKLQNLIDSHKQSAYAQWDIKTVVSHQVLVRA